MPKKLQSWLTKQEFEEFANLIPNTKNGLKMRALTETLFATGMRISEALSLKVKDIDFNKQPVEGKVVSGKSKKERPVIFTEQAVEWLKKYLNGRTSGWLFEGKKGEQLKSVSVRKFLIRLRTKHGLRKQITSHTFRRSCATQLLNEGNFNVKSVQQVLGHKNPQTTLQYYTFANLKFIRQNYQAAFN